MKKKQIILASLVLAVIIVGAAQVLWRQSRSASDQFPKAANSDAPTANKAIDVLAILPLTGRAGVYGKYVENGFELYLHEHPDTNLAVRYLDSQADPKVALSGLLQELQRKRPDVLVSALSHVSEAVLSRAESDGIFTLVQMASSGKLLEHRDLAQRISPTVADVIEPVLAETRRHYRTIAVFHSNEEWGVAAKDYIVGGFSGEGRDVVSIIGYDLGERDFGTMVQAAIKEEPEAVYVVGVGPAYVGIMTALKTFGYKGRVLTDGNLAITAIEAALGTAAEDAWYPGTDLQLKEPIRHDTVEFLRRYRERYASEPINNVAFAYDTLAILDELSRKGLRIDSQDSYRAIGGWAGVLTHIQFREGGECAVELVALRYHDGFGVPLSQSNSSAED